MKKDWLDGAIDRAVTKAVKKYAKGNWGHAGRPGKVGGSAPGGLSDSSSGKGRGGGGTEDHVSYIDNLWEGKVDAKLAEQVDWSSQGELEDVLMKKFPGITLRQAADALAIWQSRKKEQEFG